MSFRLRNQNSPEITLSMTTPAWFGILDLAEEFGWNPMGTVLPEWWLGGELAQFGYDLPERARDWRASPPSNGWPLDDWPDDDDANDRSPAESGRLVLLEDALNLADALERAFMAYEPQRTHSLAGYFSTALDGSPARTMPGIGAIVAVTDFARIGAFSIEKHSRA